MLTDEDSKRARIYLRRRCPALGNNTAAGFHSILSFVARCVVLSIWMYLDGRHNPTRPFCRYLVFLYSGLCLWLCMCVCIMDPFADSFSFFFFFHTQPQIKTWPWSWDNYCSGTEYGYMEVYSALVMRQLCRVILVFYLDARFLCRSYIIFLRDVCMKLYENPLPSYEDKLCIWSNLQWSVYLN